jgi:excisionase family DNA binding protein
MLYGLTFKLDELGYLTPREAAAELDYHVVHIYRLLKQGKFPNAKKFGSSWGIPEDDVQRIKVQQTEGGRYYPPEDG